MEYKAGVDSGVCILSKEAGVVESVCADEIKVKYDSGKLDIFKVTKFMRSNQGTCVNQVPVVSQGQRVEKGEVLADGPATSNGEISLGKNALIGFMTWEGYNYEDAVLISEKSFAMMFIHQFILRNIKWNLVIRSLARRKLLEIFLT